MTTPTASAPAPAPRIPASTPWAKLYIVADHGDRLNLMSGEPGHQEPLRWCVGLAADAKAVPHPTDVDPNDLLLAGYATREEAQAAIDSGEVLDCDAALDTNDVARYIEQGFGVRASTVRVAREMAERKARHYSATLADVLRAQAGQVGWDAIIVTLAHAMSDQMEVTLHPETRYERALNLLQQAAAAVTS